jgi:hypothetical protein
MQGKLIKQKDGRERKYLKHILALFIIEDGFHLIDGYLTILNVAKHGPSIEANPLWRPIVSNLPLFILIIILTSISWIPIYFALKYSVKYTGIAFHKFVVGVLLLSIIIDVYAILTNLTNLQRPRLFGLSFYEFLTI